MSDFTHEMKLEDFETICNIWLFEPTRRNEIETRLAEIGIVAKGVPFGDNVYLDVSIPEHIYIAAPLIEEETEQS